MSSLLRYLVLANFLVIVSSVSVAAQSGSVRYVYDALGRLVAVVDQNGDAAIYTYDAVGNLLSITRESSGTVRIASFSPPSGPIGTSVTIFGVGFSDVLSENSVSFNGTLTDGQALYYLLTLPAANRETIERTFRGVASVSPPHIGFLGRAAVETILNGGRLTPDDPAFRKIAAATDQLLVGAYDRESFLRWRRSAPSGSRVS